MSRRPAFFWWVAVFGAALGLCYAAAGVELWRSAAITPGHGWSMRWTGGSWQVVHIVPEWRNPTIRVGDRVLAVNGLRGDPQWVLARLVMLIPAGQAYTLTVERDGRMIDAPMYVRKLRTPLPWGIPPQFAGGLFCFAVAILMGLTKPGDRTAQFGCITFLSLAAVHLSRVLALSYWSLDPWGRGIIALTSVANPLPAAFGYLFAERLPRQPRARPWWRIVAVAVCAGIGFEWLMLWPERIVSAMNAAAIVSSLPWIDRLLAAQNGIPQGVWKVTGMAAMFAISAVLMRNYRALPQPDLRRRIRWVTFGGVVGLLPEAIVAAGGAAYLATGYGFRTDSVWFGRAEEMATAFTGIACSLAVGYGVLQRKVLDIHIVVRRSIQYLLAKRVLQTAIWLPIAVLVARGILNPQLTVKQLLFGSYFFLGMLAAAALALFYRRPLLDGLDRRFFREAYNQERILRTLIEDIRERDSITDISRLVSEKVDAALHPRRILVFYRQEGRGDFTLGHLSEGVEPELRVSSGSGLLVILEQDPSPRDFPFSNSGEAPPAEAEYFEKLGVRLVAPILGSERRLVGLLMLGEKRSESPYTSSDRDLLQAIAGQLGVVYENISLRESARKEAQIKRNVLARLDGTEIDLLKECPRCGACYDRAAEQCPADGAVLNLTLPVARLVDGVYRLERRIGTGAMGAVYRATDLRLSRPVAIKIMTGSLFGNRAALRRFEREARSAARLCHPNIVAIHDFGSVGADGAYLVMELVEGETWRAELRRAGALAPAVAERRFDQLLEGLSAAHAGGVVHRDLKPENLILARLTGGGELLKILDFGLAKVMPVEGGSASLTMAGAVAGTLGYMAPEQLLGDDVDDRTDTFAVGILAVEALTGHRPFAGLSFHELLQATLRQAYHLPGTGEDARRLDAVIGRCLAKSREQRPRIAEIRRELVDAIGRFQGMSAGEAAGEQETIDGTQYLG